MPKSAQILFVLLFSVATPSFALIPVITFGGFGYDADVGGGLTLTLNGLSDDGSTVFGGAQGTHAGAGFYWKKSEGLQFLPQVPLHASYDGGVLAGDSFIWSKPKGITTLPFTTTALSTDGSTLIGQDTTGGVRWTAAQGAQRLDFRPTALSGDGKVVAGTNKRNVIVWTPTGEKSLGRLDVGYMWVLRGGGLPTPDIIDVLVSRDGRVVAGNQLAYPLSPPSVGFLSVDGAQVRPVDVGQLSSFNLISGDGKVLYGTLFAREGIRYTLDSSGAIAASELTINTPDSDSSFDGSIAVNVNSTVSAAFYWDSRIGSDMLLTALHDKGVDVDPYGEGIAGTGTRAAFVSDDGLVFASDTRHQGFANLSPSFWIADLRAIPEASSYAWTAAGVIGVLFFSRRRTHTVVSNRPHRSV